jgi:hypothetical protein
LLTEAFICLALALAQRAPLGKGGYPGAAAAGTRDTSQGYGAAKSGGPIPPSGTNHLDDDIPF